MKISARPPAFTYIKQHLNADRIPASYLAEKYGTPLYVYSASTIRERYRAFDTAFKRFPHSVCYSVKANSNLALLKLLFKIGAGFDVVSGGELERVLTVSKKAARNTVFSGVGKSSLEIDAALKADILIFNVESESELEFGVALHDVGDLYTHAARNRYLDVAGVSVHIGSQITSADPFGAAMQRVAEIVRALKANSHNIRYVDAGGGLGIAYKREDVESDFTDRIKSYAAAVMSALADLGVHLLLEPGRSIVGPAGALLTRVVVVKQNGNKKFVIVDAAMNDLIRPSLYGAHHEIIPAEANVQIGGNGAAAMVADIVGPVCETGDFFARDRQIQAVKEGDLLAILDAGAYGMSLASNYNSRPRAAEVMVDGTSAKVIRRRETMRDLMDAER